MKKYLLGFMTIVMVTIGSSTLISCSKSENESNVSNEGDVSIVGKWLCDDDEFSWTFHADGTGYLQEYNGKQQITGTWLISYVYDSKKGILVTTDMPTDDHHGEELDTDIYDVIVLTATKLILREQGESRTKSFTRQ